MASPTSFIELNDYWLSITREDFALRGFGKWMLSTDEPHQLFQILKGEMQDGGLPDVFSVKTLEEPKEKKLGEVYLFTAPYTDRKKVTRVASELKGLTRNITSI